MMSCGGPGFNTGNNYNNGSYLGPPPIELKFDYSPGEPGVLYIIPHYFNYKTTSRYYAIRIETKQNSSNYRSKAHRKTYYIGGKKYFNDVKAFRSTWDTDKTGIYNSNWNYDTTITVNNINRTMPSHFGRHIISAANHGDRELFWYVRATYRDTLSATRAGSRNYISSNLVKIIYPSDYL